MHRKALVFRLSWGLVGQPYERPSGLRRVVYRLKAGEASWQLVAVRVAKD